LKKWNFRNEAERAGRKVSPVKDFQVRLLKNDVIKVLMGKMVSLLNPL
jgi:hypothetical protein